MEEGSTTVAFFLSVAVCTREPDPKLRSLMLFMAPDKFMFFFGSVLFRLFGLSSPR